MMEVKTISLSEKQLEAFKILNDKETTELFYGGGAGGGKSFLGCVWLINSCLNYPNTRWLMGRAILKTIKESTLLTFFSACKDVFNLKAMEDYKYNSMEGRIVFLKTGSEVYLKDLFQYPSDPEFDSLGSTEYTGAFIDEVSEITEKAKNIVMSRLRYKLDQYDLVPKLLMASNPAKNFAYREYWKPWRDGTLKPYRRFVPALVGDNPYISDYYAENLNKLDKNTKERLLFGNWDYDDDPSRLFDYKDIMAMFDNAYQEKPKEQRYLTVDVARYGPDKTVLIYWKGLHMEKIKSYPKTSMKQVRELIESACYYDGIPRKNVIIDEGGVGGGVVDETQGVKGFISNATAIEMKEGPRVYKLPPQHNFANLKSQCYFYLSKYIQEGLISCTNEININDKDCLIEDLQQIKVKDPDKDKKLQITPKEEIKESLGRSPDFGDSMMMRMYFELRPKTLGYISVK